MPGGACIVNGNGLYHRQTYPAGLPTIGSLVRHPLGDLFRRFCSDRKGSVALIFGLSFPALIVLVLVAIELRSLTNDRGRLQELADTAALNAASQMRIGANQQLLERARAATIEQAADLTARLESADLQFIDEIDGRSGVVVSLVARRTSFFGNMLPPGGFVLRASAVAQQLGATPLCVLVLSESSGTALHMPKGELIARSCLAHSNRDIQLAAQGRIDAAAVQASGSIKGGSPANSGSNAPVIPDPLVGLFASGPPACTATSDVEADEDDEVRSVPAGVHCRHFDIEEGTLKLLPGVHHFRSGELQLKVDAKLEGANVTLVFWKDVKVTFSDGKVDRLTLSGNQSAGDPWAGVVIAIDPARTNDFTFNFDDIRRLEGVIYAPGTRLIVPGGANSNDATPWTVVVARELRVEGGRRLSINADYASSSVPVPNGVGNRATGGGPTRLTH